MTDLQLPFSGESLKQTGMQMAIDSADELHPNWSALAYEKLIEYLQLHEVNFKGENFRLWAEINGLPKPRHGRSYGSILSRAAKNGLIERVGFTTTVNPKTHKATCSLWRKCNKV